MPDVGSTSGVAWHTRATLSSITSYCSTTTIWVDAGRLDLQSRADGFRSDALHNRPPDEPNAELLAEPVAERLLARASELDAARGAGATIHELRAAAAEAGISADAFNAALAEMQGEAKVPDARGQRRRGRIRALAIAAAILMGVTAVFVTRRAIPTDAAVAAGPMVEESIVLRCLSSGEAAELVRPLLRLSTNTIVAGANATRVLTIRATPAQIQSVQSVLDQHERAGSPACATAPAPRPNP